MLTCLVYIFMAILLKLCILMFTICLFSHPLQVPHCILDFEKKKNRQMEMTFCGNQHHTTCAFELNLHRTWNVSFNLYQHHSNHQTDPPSSVRGNMCKSWHVMAPCCLLRETHCVPQVAGAAQSSIPDGHPGFEYHTKWMSEPCGNEIIKRGYFVSASAGRSGFSHKPIHCLSSL